MPPASGGSVMSAKRYYASGVAAAEAAMVKSVGATVVFTGENVSRYNGNNFVTNQVSLTEFSDRRVADEGAVLGLSTAFGCVNLLAGTTGTLPCMVYRTDVDGRRTIARDHPLYQLLHDSPNYDQTAVDFWEFIAACLELRGNAYAEISRVGSRIVSLTPIAPQMVTVRRIRNGSLEYRVCDQGGERIVAQDDILHIRGFGGSPLGGLSTLSLGANVFGGALDIERASSATFRNGMRPSAVLETDTQMNGEQRATAEQLLREKYTGALNAGTPLLLDNGVKFKGVTLNPEDAQMLQSRAFSVEEVCRFFGVPPFMVGHTEKSTSWGTGIEQQTIGFVQFTLRRRLKRIEQASEKQLLTATERSQGYRIEFNLDGLLRGDSKTRADFYASGLQNGWRTINEVRALENLPPVPGGDVPRMQMQNVPITEAAQVTELGSPQ